MRTNGGKNFRVKISFIIRSKDDFSKNDIYLKNINSYNWIFLF